MSASITAEGPLKYSARVSTYHGQQVVEGLILARTATRPNGRLYEHRIAFRDFRPETCALVAALGAGVVVRATGFPAATITVDSDGQAWAQNVVSIDAHRGTLEVLP
jgi:hypothetical protein